MTALDYYRQWGGKQVCRQQIQILATDISSTVLSKAVEGKYDNTAMLRGLPHNKRTRHFTQQDDIWTAKNEVKEMVTFKKINLQEPFSGLGRFDIVFLRNVIIYFSDSFKKELLNRVARILKPGGYLFLGAGETVHGYTSAFDVVECHGAIYSCTA